MKKILKIGGYARVSHEEQKKFGYSINAQVDEIHSWCGEKGHQLIDIYVDEGYSASNMKRPQLQRMLKNLKDLDAIAFTRLDRFSRNVLEANKMLELLEKNNVALISISEDDINTTTANGLFMFNLKVNLAEHELKKGSERIKAVFNYKIQNGQAITGRLPLGYKIEDIDGMKRVVKDPETAHIVEDIFGYFLKHQTLNGTVRYASRKYNLNRAYETYKKMLKNELYTGKFHSNENYTEPYISKETHQTIQEILNKNIRTGLMSHTYLFSGLIRCPLCNTKLSGVCNRSKSGSLYYYRCNRRYSDHVCTNTLHVSEKKIEAYMLKNIDSLIPQYIAQIKELQTNVSDDVESKIKDVKREMESLNYMFMKKRIDVNAYDKLYEALEEKLTKLKENAPKIKNTQILQDFLSSNWKNIYQDMTKENKRSIWRGLIKEIHVDEKCNVVKVIFV